MSSNVTGAGDNRLSTRQPHTVHVRRVWLRGGIALAGDAFFGTVNIVHGVHRAINQTVARLNPAAQPVAWTGDFVYARIRDIGRLSYAGLGQTLAWPKR